MQFDRAFLYVGTAMGLWAPHPSTPLRDPTRSLSGVEAPKCEPAKQKAEKGPA